MRVHYPKSLNMARTTSFRMFHMPPKDLLFTFYLLNCLLQLCVLVHDADIIFHIRWL